MKTALIIGIKGQDGFILQEHLKPLSYRVIGIDKDYISPGLPLPAAAVDIACPSDVERLVSQIQPDEIYYFAAYHHSSEDAVSNDLSLYIQSHPINVVGLLNFLESIRTHSPHTKLFYASSSLIFGSTDTEIQNEQTPPCPDTMYGITKLTAQQLCRYYRENHSVFASVGIMYNHESHLRTENFLSKKIVKTAIQIQRKEQNALTVGDLKAEVDWGYAPDYMDAIYKIIQLRCPGEFIVSSGFKHSVREFIAETFSYLGLDYNKYVVENSSILTRKQYKLLGDNRKLRQCTGWAPATSFKQMIHILVERELRSP
jgi:GDPmannose 4,6-dehydratase